MAGMDRGIQMTTQPKPWHKYRGQKDWKDLIPGYAGTLDDEQVAFIQSHLVADPALSFSWGYRPSTKRRSEASIRRVGYSGDPESRATNVRLVREAGRRANADNESLDSCVTKSFAPTSAPLGRKRKESWESAAVRLAQEGQSLREIAAHLQGQGVEISYRSVARRLAELRG